MMIKRFKRRFSISAPRLAVRPHVPWYIRWAIMVPLVIIVGLMIWWAYDFGLELAGFHRGEAERELSVLQDRVVFLEGENAKQANQLAAYERQMQIETAADAEVNVQIRNLTEENTRLKEDLLFFQNLPLTSSREAELSIHRLKFEADTLPGEFHCRMLLVQSVRQRGREFRGNMQVVVNGERDGEKVVLQFPAEHALSEAAGYELNFKYYQRVDKLLKLPPDFKIDEVQVRVFEKGIPEPRAKQVVSFAAAAS